MKQVSFSFLRDYKKEFGGELLLNKRKSARPLSIKKPIHLVLKSNHRGLFNPGNVSLEELIRSQAKKYNLHLYDLALNWSHIHLLFKLKDRRDYLKFIRSLTSLLSIKIRKAKPHLKEIFTLRPYTRIVSWGRDLRSAFNYLVLNQLEALGLVVRKKNAKTKRKGKNYYGEKSKREKRKTKSAINV